MSKSAHNGKTQRDHERITPADRVKMHELYRVNLLDVDLIAERFGMDEEAVKVILSKKPPKHEPKWQVRWYDSSGFKRVKVVESFSAAKEFHAALRNVEWSKVERV